MGKLVISVESSTYRHDADVKQNIIQKLTGSSIRSRPQGDGLASSSLSPIRPNEQRQSQTALPRTREWLNRHPKVEYLDDNEL
jgi:hypothetical protein